MEDKKVKDLMLPLSEYATVSSESTIKDAIIALDKAQRGLGNDRYHHRAILVLDKDGEVVGKLSQWAVLRKLEPKFLNTEDLSVLSKANFSSTEIGALEESLTCFWSGLSLLCSRAAGIKAKDAMVPISESIDENESLVAAIHQLVVTHGQSFVVTRNEKTIGILRLSDVFQEVAEIIRNSE